MRFRRTILAPVFPMLLLGACSDSPSSPDPFDARALPQELLPYVGDVAVATNEFALDLYGQLQEQSGNIFFSPFSIACALSMTYGGAAGVTAREMEQVLHVIDVEHWHEVFGALQASLNRGTSLGGYELSLANRMWPQINFTFLQSYVDLLTSYYGAALEYLDFAADPELARVTINNWVEDETNGRIQDLIQPGLITELTRLVLTNAIYFKGTWLTQFDPEDTYDGAFRISNGTTVTVPLMMLEGQPVMGASGHDATIISLPYAGEDISMVVILPDRTDGLPELEQNLSSIELKTWIDSMHEIDFETVVLPKFSFTCEFQLADALSALGMPSAFDPGTADLSGMTGLPELFIRAVVHKAFVDVNEEGTEAAAATAVIIDYTAAGPVFIADHPFIFLLYDHVTETILFMGRVVNPVA